LRGQQSRRQIRLRRQGGCGFSCGEISAERNYSLIGELSENLLTSIDRAKHRKAEPFHVTTGNGKFLSNHVNCKCERCLYVFGFLSMTVTPYVLLCRYRWLSYCNYTFMPHLCRCFLVVNIFPISDFWDLCLLLCLEYRLLLCDIAAINIILELSDNVQDW